MKKTDYPDIDSKQLRLLLTIYESGSITLAGQMLDMNQSTVSYQLDRLREKFNDPLFVRSGQGVIPTDRTERMVPQARSLLHALNEFSQGDIYNPELDTGVLRIAANALERDLVVKPLLDKARSLAPNLSIEIHATGSTHQVVDGLRDGLFDFAIFPTGGINADNIMQRVLFSMQFNVFCDEQYAPAKINKATYCNAAHGLISLGPNARSHIDDVLLKDGYQRNVILQAADFDTLAILMKGTPILATLPNLYQYSSFKGFKMFDFPWKKLTNELAIFWHARQHNAKRNQYWRRLAVDLKYQLT